MKNVNRYIRKHWLPFTVFGSLLAGIGIVSIYGLHVDGRKVFDHIWNREVQAHWGWGTAAYILFGRLVLLGERLNRKRKNKAVRLHLPWLWWYLTPYLMLMACVCFQEFWPWTFPKLGDYFSTGVPYKSFADLMGWTFGAIPGAWATYFMADRYFDARQDYLAWKKGRVRWSARMDS